MAQYKLDIDKLIEIDDTGMPIAPSIRQLLDKDIRELYKRDNTENKDRYIKDCIVIYYLGDPKSPAKQAGLSDVEALKMAIEQADLPKDYIPDTLVINLIKKYYEQNIGEAGRTIQSILGVIHNINVSIETINNIITEKLKTTTDLDSIETILRLVDSLSKKASELPNIIKKLQEARENLMYEKETEVSRGGNIVSSSMDAESYL